MTDHLVGIAELAEMLAVSRQRAAQIASTHKDFPQPEVELASGRVWKRSTIELWMAKHPDRRPGRPRSSSS